MPRSFRFTPPEPRPGAVPRPRLLQVLLGRWERQVTLVRGGPGLGKTTLLAQALAENRLAPRGRDVWIGVEPADNDGDVLGEAVAHALVPGEDPGAREPVGRTPHAAAEAIWQGSPSQVCVVLDDVHLLAPGSAGAAWLEALIAALPVNGHLLLSSRCEPSVTLARLDGMGMVLRLSEDDLRLSAAELDDFACAAEIPADHLAGTGGWAAMAELAARGGERAEAYLWEEVLEPLGPDRRRLLAIVADLGGADDRLATAAIGTQTDVGRQLADVPLVAASTDGWYVPHDLWRSASPLALVLDPTERVAARRRAVGDLLGRGDIDQAFTLVKDAELWDEAPSVLRSACLESERLNPRQLERLLDASPMAVRTSPAGCLAGALRLAFTQPNAALGALRTAATVCQDAGDVEGELTALAQLGRLAWGRQDAASIRDPVATRIAALEAGGHPMASAMGSLIRAFIADVTGDDLAVIAELDAIGPGVLDPVWSAMATWLRGGVRLDQGEPGAVAEMLETVTSTNDPAITAILGGLRTRTWWALGRIDDALGEIPAILVALRDAGVASIHAQGLVNAALALSFTGDTAGAAECLAEAHAAANEPPDGPSVRTALAIASLQVAQHDEPAAVATLRRALAIHGGPDIGAHRRVWRHVLSLSYVLVPETRNVWDATALRGHLAHARTLAEAIVAIREDTANDLLWRLDLAHLGRVRAALHHRHAADLAVALTAAGRPEGQTLLDALGPPGRTAVGDIATSEPHRAKSARALLAAVPAPPPLTTHLAVLGPLTISRNAPFDAGRSDAVLHRARVRALLGFLIGHRKTHRGAITAALWPDLDPQAANNNLGVTLNHLLRALEPWRRSGEPSYLIRLDGPTVHLRTGAHLRIDTDEFDHHIASAARAETEGNATAALAHHLAATNLYRDDYLVELPDADWLDLERMHYRSRFIASTTRAAQLLAGSSDTNQAEQLAQRVLRNDPWNEDAYAVLATAAMTRGDHTNARATLQKCSNALADLGATPSTTTLELARRCGSSPT